MASGNFYLNNGNATRNVSALVVDDDNTSRIVLTMVLRSQGFEICAVESARDAIDLFRNGKKFDVVFMDIVMPVMNGIQATRILREMSVTSMIVGVEVDVPRWDAQELIDAGIDRFYEKPMRCISAALLHQELMNMHE